MLDRDSPRSRRVPTVTSNAGASKEITIYNDDALGDFISRVIYEFGLYLCPGLGTCTVELLAGETWYTWREYGV